MRTLASRIALQIFIVTFLCVAATLAVLTYLNNKKTESALAEQAGVMQHMLVPTVQAFIRNSDPSGLIELIESLRNEEIVTDALVVDSDFNNLAVFNRDPTNPNKLSSNVIKAMTFSEKGNGSATSTVTTDNSILIVTAVYGMNRNIQTIIAMKIDSTNAKNIAWQEAKQLALLCLGATMLIALVIYILLIKSMKPLKTLTASVNRLILGDLDVKVPFVKHNDEIKLLSDAFGVLRNALSDREKMQLTRDVDNKNRMTEIELRNSLVADLKSSMEQSLSTLGTESAGMKLAADRLKLLASGTFDRSLNATKSVQETTEAVSNVAQAAEEMSLSISEIDVKSNQVKQVATKATQLSVSIATQVEDLAVRIQDVGQVVTVIRTIAAQTNLLALNATIEAARAGAAGRGFAVVAQEVKALANQTALATEAVATQVNAVQAATTETVSAIRSIAQDMADLESATVDIATVMTQQTATTSEIARSASNAAVGIAGTNNEVMALSGAAQQTDEAAIEVNHSADAMQNEEAQLRAAFEKFLIGVDAVSQQVHAA
jgi:methyl-accepting chemotaxis protein